MDSLLSTDTYVDGAKFITLKMVDKLPDMTVSALTLVTALTWNEAAQGLVKYYTPESWKEEGKRNPWVKIGYATILTVIVTLIIMAIITSQHRVERLLK